jgi:hypothetical protein
MSTETPQTPSTATELETAGILLCETNNDTFICLDHTGALAIGPAAEIGGKTLFTRRQTVALYGFLTMREDVKDLMIHLWRADLLARGNPDLNALVALCDKHLPPLPPLPPSQHRTVAEMPALEVTMEGSEGHEPYPVYRFGDLELSLEDGSAQLFGGGYELVTWFRDPKLGMSPVEALAMVRNLATFLALPAVRQALGLGTPPPIPAPAISLPFPKFYQICQSKEIGELYSGGGPFNVPFTFRRIDGQLYINVGEDDWEWDGGEDREDDEHPDAPQIVRSITRMARRAILMVDTDEECFLLTEAEFLAHGGEWSDLGLSMLPIQMERYTSPDESYSGTRFTAGQGDDKAEVWVPDDKEDEEINRPFCYSPTLSGDEVPLADAARALPNLAALLASEEVKQAVARWEATA